jgi:sec-independent protein translocase protein TatA
MGAFSLSHILVVAVLAVLLFGRGKLSQLMGDLGAGIRGFRGSMAEDDSAPAVGSRPEAAKLTSAAPARDA